MKKNTNYRCSQQELYAICKLGWEGCHQHIEQFAGFSPKYNAAFIDARKAEIDATITTPDNALRSSGQEVLRLQLKDQVRNCLNAWQKLKRYIYEAYPENLQAPKLKGAGQGYYSKASALNWEACQGLMYSGTSFIANESILLLANENMPPGFAAEFKAAKEAFEAMYLQYMQGNKTAGQRTTEKAKANNDLYAALISMFLDGQEIFKDQPSICRQFMFDSLLTVISGTHTAGLKGRITVQTIDGAPIAGAQVRIAGTGNETDSDADGYYQLIQVGAGIYTIEVSAVGYKDLALPGIEVKTGTVSNLQLQLLPV
jgi:hypothetical protein